MICFFFIIISLCFAITLSVSQFLTVSYREGIAFNLYTTHKEIKFAECDSLSLLNAVTYDVSE